MRTVALPRSVTSRAVSPSLSFSEPASASDTHKATLGRVKRTDTSDWPCTVARSVDVLGDHWNLLLIRQACLGTRRFDDFHAALGIGRNILTQRLARLVDEGILTKVPYQENPARFEYRLTDKGRDVYPILAAMAAWGERWLTGPERTPLVLHHTTCDHDMRAVVVCSECEEPIDVRQVRATAGPGYPKAAAR
jgi:DNA-binding HxlR family transcriptional regulator